MSRLSTLFYYSYCWVKLIRVHKRMPRLMQISVVLKIHTTSFNKLICTIRIKLFVCMRRIAYTENINFQVRPLFNIEIGLIKGHCWSDAFIKRNSFHFFTSVWVGIEKQTWLIRMQWWVVFELGSRSAWSVLRCFVLHTGFVGRATRLEEEVRAA